jgi:hypothetical protein
MNGGSAIFLAQRTGERVVLCCRGMEPAKPFDCGGVMDLTTRELSIIFWSIVVLAWAISKAEDRSPFYNLLKIAAAPFFLGFFGSLALYATGEVFLLYSLGLWKSSLLKTTLVWFVVIAVSSSRSAIVEFDDPPYWKPVVDGLRVMVLLEIVASLTTFPLPVELVLIPLATLLTLFTVLAKRRSVEAPNVKVFNAVLVYVGLFMLGIGTVRVIGEFHLVGSGVLFDFFLPPLLSLLFIPAVYCSAMYSRYDWLFRKIQGERKYCWYAKYRMVRLLRFKPKRVVEFGRRFAFELPMVRTREEFDVLISKCVPSEQASGSGQESDTREAA